MTDFYDELRELTREAERGATMREPSEVRRLGTRRRHRHVAMWTAVGVAVTALGVTGFIERDDLFNAGRQSVPAGPTGTATTTTQGNIPAVNWVMTIPESFPLGDGLPQPGGDVPAWQQSDDRDQTIQYVPCEDRRLDAANSARTDARSIVASPPAETQWRYLVLYENAAAAEAARTEIRDRAAACGSQPSQPGITETRWTVTDQMYGEHSFVELAGREYALDTEQEGIHRSTIGVFQTGNALLIGGLSDEGGGQTGADSGLDAWAASLAGVADAMCVFTADPCGGGVPPTTGTEQPPADEALSEDNLPTADQIPWSERFVFEQTEPQDGELTQCAKESWEALGADSQLRRDFRRITVPGAAPAEYNAYARSMALDFASEADAQTAYQTISQWIQSCATTLQGHFYDRASGGDQWTDVNVKAGQARFAELSYGPVPGTGTDEVGFFESVGLARVGDRVLVVSLVDISTESHWSYAPDDPTGLPMHPFFTTLPGGADNLAR
jgi:hypothetical protein